MTTMQKALQDCVEALDIGLDLAKNHAENTHAAYAGYYPSRHKQVDGDVALIDAAIKQAKQVLANSAIDQMIEITQELGLYPSPKNEPTN